MATPKQAHILTSYFVAKYREKYNLPPKVNRNTARWQWDGMLEDLDELHIKELIDYYFTTVSPNAHPLDWFLYNYDKIDETMDAVNRDRAAAALMREESKRRTAAWKEKNGIQD